MDDIHFLERLERVSMVHMDLALGLYRNPDLVRFVLQTVAPPDGVDTVALALDHSPEPPWVLVDRQGRFVTCLAKGMVPRACWRVSRHRLDALARKHERLGQAFAKFDALAADPRSFVRLWTSLIRDAHLVSRAPMNELIPVANLIASTAYKSLLRVVETRGQLLLEGSRLLNRRHRLNARESALLGALWRTEWAIGHLAVLIGSVERDTLEPLVKADESLVEQLVAVMLMGGLWPTAVRVCWMAARIPWRGLRPLSHLVEAGQGRYPGGISRALALAFFATRVGAGRPDAIDTLERLAALREVGLDDDQRLNGAFAARLLTALRPRPDVPDPARAALVDDPDEGLLTFWQLAQPAGTPLPVTGSLAGDLQRARTPEGLAVARRARTVWSNLPVCAFNHRGVLDILPHALGWAARAAPRNFYLPEAELDRIAEPWSPELPVPWLAGLDKAYGGLGRVPVRRQGPKIGRNAPCPCHSGKKHKRCCGA